MTCGGKGRKNGRRRKKVGRPEIEGGGRMAEEEGRTESKSLREKEEM
jgi:hypothetical protein